MSERIPVYAGSRILEICDEVSVRRYLDAPNAECQFEFVRKRKTGKIVQVNLREMGDDSKRNSHAGGRALTYEESLAEGNARLVTLKRFDERNRQYVRWSDRDGFNPMRFNSDRLKPLRPDGLPQARISA